MLAVWHELRESARQIGLFRQDLDARTAVAGHATYWTGFAAEEDIAVRVPRASTSEARTQAEFLCRPADRGYRLQFSVREKSDKAAVGRPERRSSIQSRIDPFPFGTVERTHPQSRLVVPSEYRCHARSIRRDLDIGK